MREKHKRIKVKWIILVCLLCMVKLTGCDKTEQKESVSKEPVSKESDVPFQTLPEEKEDFWNRYFYQQMTEKEQLVYQEILQGIQTETKEIYLHSEDGPAVLEIYGSLLYDYPEIFWCTGQADATTMDFDDERENYVILEPVYAYEGEEKARRQQEIETAAAACLAGISPEASDYEKIHYIYNYIVQTTDYVLESPDNQNLYSVLVNRQSVCAGYARANQYLLGKLNVACIYVSGTATSPESGTQAHGWNIVNCEGEYYQVDVTWGDPVFNQEAEALPGDINYDYLCCTDAEIFKTHVIDPELYVPQCNSITYNYYVVNGLYYEVFDAAQILNVMKNSIDMQAPSVTFKFANDQVYQEASNVIINDLVIQAAQYLGERYGLPNVRYYYQENAPINRLTLTWDYISG